MIERFSFEYRKVICFAFTTLRDCFKKLAPLFHPIRSKTKTNRDSLLRVFPPFASATCNYFAFWLVHLIICALCDGLEWLLWFWFYDTQMKTALRQLHHLGKLRPVFDCVDIAHSGRALVAQRAAKQNTITIGTEPHACIEIEDHAAVFSWWCGIYLGCMYLDENDNNIIQHSSNIPANRSTSHASSVYSTHLWYWTSMLLVWEHMSLK